MNNFRNTISVVAFLVTPIIAGSTLATQPPAPSATPASHLIPSTPTSVVTEPININLTDLVTLQKIKGMGKKKSQAIINYRNQNGKFKSLEDLLKINCRGINKKWLGKISKSLTL